MSSPLILQVSMILGHPTYCTECRNKSLRVSHCNCHIREWWSCLLKDKDWNLPIFELDHLLLSIGRRIKIMTRHWVWFNPFCYYKYVLANMAALGYQFYNALCLGICVNRRLNSANFRTWSSSSEYRETNQNHDTSLDLI